MQWMAEVSDLRVDKGRTPAQDRQYEHTNNLYFEAPSLLEAAEGVGRWMANRQRNLPDYFCKFSCVKLYGFEMHEIAEDGTYHSSNGFNLFEWKYDTAGCTYDRYVQIKLG